MDVGLRNASHLAVYTYLTRGSPASGSRNGPLTTEIRSFERVVGNPSVTGSGKGCPSSTHNRGKLRMESDKPNVEASERFTLLVARARSIDSCACFAWSRQKFSICHTFLVGLISRIASNRPSGDGMAYPMKLSERSKTETLPSSVTLSNALSDL